MGLRKFLVILPLFFILSISCQALANSAVEEYLQNLKTLQANFTQLEEDKPPSRGKVFFSKEGKIRWDYDTPKPVSIIIKGKVATFYDKELEEESSIFIDKEITSWIRNPNFLIDEFQLNVTPQEYIFCKLRGNQDLTVIFNKEPVFLKKLISSQDNKEIEIEFSDLKENISFSKYIFQYKKSS